MAQPVWVLSVDLQAKTATFASGMADAARSARGAFQDIKSGSDDMAAGVSGGTTNIRAALGLLDNTIRGAHGAAMADLIREFSDTKIVMAALPFLPVAGGLLFLAGTVVGVVSKIREYREEQQKLTQDQTKFGTGINEAFNALNDKLLTAEQRSDELRNDHLGALQKQLELIDHQSLAELVHSFETVSKAASLVFGDLQSHWYTMGIGADGAKHALEDFQTKYESLLAAGKDKEASDLLQGTRDSAQKILEAQKAAQGSQSAVMTVHGPEIISTAYAALNTLKAVGVGYTDNETKAQQALVDALNAQLSIEQKIAALKKADSSNAGMSTAQQMSRERSEAARQSVDSQLRMGEMAVAADRSTAQAQLEVAHASIQQRADLEEDFANREYAMRLTANQEQIAALDKLGKDYPNQLKAMQDKALELEQQHDTALAQIRSQASEQMAEKALRDLQESEREQIDATQQGSAARLAAIDAALKEEAAKNLQNEESYRALQQQRVETARQMAQQELQARIQGIEAATKIDEQSLSAQFNVLQAQLRARNASIEQQAAAEVANANAIYQTELKGLNQELTALQKSGAAKVAEVEKVQQQIKTLTQTHENQVSEIQQKAATEQSNQYNRAMASMETSAAHGLMSMLSGQKSFTSEMGSLGQQLTASLVQAGIERLNGVDSTKLANAKTAASNVYGEVSGWPVVGPFLAPELAAGAFSAVMAFEKGGVVPGTGTGDTVPALLTPGEGVVPRGVMDSLQKLAQNGGFGSGPTNVTHNHFHYRPQIHAIDGPSVDKMLDKHGDKFAKKMNNHLRKMNK